MNLVFSKQTLYVVTMVYVIDGNDYVNVFNLIYDDINGIKEKDLVDYIEKNKG